jgi:hypothetical protein
MFQAPTTPGIALPTLILVLPNDADRVRRIGEAARIVAAQHAKLYGQVI